MFCVDLKKSKVSAVYQATAPPYTHDQVWYAYMCWNAGKRGGIDSDTNIVH